MCVSCPHRRLAFMELNRIGNGTTQKNICIYNLIQMKQTEKRPKQETLMTEFIHAVLSYMCMGTWAEMRLQQTSYAA